MVAPRMLGEHVRASFEQGRGAPAEASAMVPLRVPRITAARRARLVRCDMTRVMIGSKILRV
jgi:hypothetical protein